MPIELQHSIHALSEQAFHQLDYEIMALAFEVHSQLGRFYNEQIYQNKLKQKCLDKGLRVDSEFKIKLTHRNYTKPLFVDLLIENSVYELKAIRSIQKPQRIQTLNYLFSTNTQHGKIINFLPSSVEHEFISTSLNHTARKQITFQHSQWQAHSTEAENLETLMRELLVDWGAFFDTHLYEEAIVHLLETVTPIVRRVKITSNNQLLGSQKLNVLSNAEFFAITAARSNITQHKNNLIKLLKHTPFKYLYWINLNHSEIQFATLESQEK
jgi:GxxExxY protein